ncbi:hypothetical protein [Chitinophaga sp. S165]|uniref:hypothetical protein n=1 Tax=Chitinophaga sp. S165 TaxID=2135462 RepID=UPI000D70C9B2|nr:hypothetical protein [Chitinophaga sp. S165]PWV55828.1 hypothetical protein C7475_101335 [Chitinophaga sp. S165]
MKRILSLLTVVILVTNQFLYAQKSTEKLVVLPFRVLAAEVKDSYGQLKAYQRDEGLMYQKAFYNALTADGRHISLEDVEVTNTRLKAAGIDLSRAYFVDKDVLCKLLKADGVITGTITEDYATLRPTRPGDKPHKWITLELYDSVTDDILWKFQDGTLANEMLDKDDASSLNRYLAKKIYKKISRYVETL